MQNPIGWFEIYVEDMERARAFYETMLQVTLEKLPDPAISELEMWTFQPADMESYGATGALVKMDDMPAGANSTLVYFSCEDCAAEQSRVEGAGGVVRQPKFPIGEHGFIAIVIDTEGNMIGLHSLK